MLAPHVADPLGLAAARLRAGGGYVRRELFAHQLPPPDPWDIWLLLAGRGSGKTEAGARYVNAHASGPACLEGLVPHRIAVVAPSHGDAVDTCVRGETGLLQVNRRIRFHPGASLVADLTWPNGAEAQLFGTFTPEDVERFRGPQHCLVWGDEFAIWRKLDDAWPMIEYGLRLGPRPHAVLTTTPKRRPLLKKILAQPTTVVSRARTSDNPHLPESRRIALYARYGGTVLGRQELDAELIEDVEGALWKRGMIEYRPVPRIMRGNVAEPNLARVVVGVDPAVSFGEDSDETGIVVDALGADGMGYALADLSGRLAPSEWARRAVQAYHEHKADRIVAEANNGGELVRTVIATVDPRVPVTLVHASRGKRTRAEPVSSLYIPNPDRPLRWFHAEPLPELEDQLCSYTGEPGEESPDRMDAHVWAITELARLGEGGWGEGTWGGKSAVATA